MKKKVAKVLKIMGTALESAHAGEMLTKEQKKKVIASQKKNTVKTTPTEKKPSANKKETV